MKLNDFRLIFIKKITWSLKRFGFSRRLYVLVCIFALNLPFFTRHVCYTYDAQQTYVAMLRAVGLNVCQEIYWHSAQI